MDFGHPDSPMTDKKKGTKAKGKSLPQPKLQNAILKFLKRHPKKTYNPKQLRSGLRVANNKDSIKNALDVLEKEGKIFTHGDYKYRLDRALLEKMEGAPRKSDENGSAQKSSKNGRSNDRRGGSRKSKKHADDEVVTGTVDMTRTGSAYIVVEGRENDVFVPERRINGALNGDTVEVRVFGGRRGRPEGEVQKVTNRMTNSFLGTVQMSKNYAFVVVDHQHVHTDIFVPEHGLNGAKNGDKVVVVVKEWPEKEGKSPVGKITLVFGEKGGSDIEMQGILVNNGFNLTFPEEVTAEAEDFREDIPVAEIHRRRDLREVLTFTIDPDDAKDFDDALSYEVLENGNREIGVHIADVTYYVRPDTALDKEAYQRSTSVYLVDRVLPMLPERLSNGLCSLRPNEDKCTFSAIFTFDKNDQIVERWFGKTVTHSDQRFTYNDAQRVIEGEAEGVNEELEDAVLTLNRLAEKLRKRRFKEGAIDFDADEVKFRLDEDGVPVEMYVKQRKAAHMLIEDFMLLANREVATYIQNKMKGKPEIPFVYRIHDEPDPDKVAELALFAKNFGLSLKTDSPRDIANAYNSLRAAARENEELKILAPIAIRTMAKAVYSSDNIGHYGLGFENYSHFTSPIRRYADVLAHRILEANLNGKTLRVNKEQLEEKCKHISIMERRAVDAERESIKYKQVEYMKHHIGEEFDGQISGIMDRGIFVEVGGGIAEGMAPFQYMDEDYDVSEGRLTATGARSGQKLFMGQKVRVSVVSADLEKRQIEMKLVETLEEAPKAKSRRRSKKGEE